MGSEMNTNGTWRAEFLAFGETHWASNALRFESESEAIDYARALRGRWTMCDKVRAVPVTTPDRESYTTGSEA
jgi:hypothetical protein